MAERRWPLRGDFDAHTPAVLGFPIVRAPASTSGLMTRRVLAHSQRRGPSSPTLTAGVTRRRAKLPTVRRLALQRKPIRETHEIVDEHHSRAGDLRRQRRRYWPYSFASIVASVSAGTVAVN